MKVGDLKILLTLMLPVLTGVFITYFFYKDIKADVYLFYDHARYLDNIFYDITNLLSVSILTWYGTRWKRNIFMPFFIISIYEWIMYFLVYKQWVVLTELPILIILILIYNRK